MVEDLRLLRQNPFSMGPLAAALVLLLSAHPAAVPKLLFPVAGPVTYQDDFGDARSDGPPHPGNDLLGVKKTPVIAVESGTVKFWTTSASAGCMLYLYGDSGTMYEYIHLNNDRTMKNDNQGKCVAGTAYAKGLKNGARVAAGQQVGYLGDSGDANGIHPHLHFEVHPNGGAAVDPFPYLQAAQHLLFFAKLGSPFALALTGTVVDNTDTSLKLQLASLQAFPSNAKLTKLAQTVTVATATPAAAAPGDAVTVWTTPAVTTVKAMLGADDALSAALVVPATP
jgi:hypothetical protein